MNEHLNPVFESILPELEKSRVRSLVYGGVAIAGIKGKFLRKNKDIDAFVLEEDFHEAERIIDNICRKNPDWIKCRSKERKREKIEIVTGSACSQKNEIFSLIPVFKIDDKMEFVFPHGWDIKFDKGVLDRTLREVDGHKFYTPPDKYIKELFLNHFEKKQQQKGANINKKYIVDKNFLDSLPK